MCPNAVLKLNTREMFGLFLTWVLSLSIKRYLQCDLDVFDLDDLECKFDVVYIDPPLEEYQRRASGTAFNWKPWTWEEVSCTCYRTHRIQDQVLPQSCKYWCPLLGPGTGALKVGRGLNKFKPSWVVSMATPRAGTTPVCSHQNNDSVTL